MGVVDTELTVYQIIALQNLHYACEAIVISLLHVITGSTVRPYLGVIGLLLPHRTHVHIYVYIALYIIIVRISCFLMPSKASLDILFLRLTSWEGVATTLISGVIGAGLLCLIVEKAKRCLDFTATVFLIHLVVCSFYGGVPISWEWWISNLLAAVTMVVGGEYLCSVYELRELPLFRYSTAMQGLNNVFHTPVNSPRGGTNC